MKTKRKTKQTEPDVRPLYLREIPLKTRKGMPKVALLLPRGFTGEQLKLYKEHELRRIAR